MNEIFTKQLQRYTAQIIATKLQTETNIAEEPAAWTTSQKEKPKSSREEATDKWAKTVNRM